MPIFGTYLSSIIKAYNAGNATEHTHRPALKILIESLGTGIVATNEPRRVKCGAPDYIITKGHTPLGYVEAKDIDKPLADVERSEQLKRYLESLGNLVLTDYLEFRWYVAGQHRLTARLASIANGKIKVDKDGELKVQELLTAFLTAKASTVSSPKELAIRMAALARLIRNAIQKAFSEECFSIDEPDPLHDQLEGFRKVLINDLTPDQFADMYAQTICYGLFASRCNVDITGPFTRESAGYALPKTNPFLRKMFNYIAGADLDDRLVWAVDDLAELLRHTDINAILKGFGKHTKQEDPVVHFYESFLAAYDQKMREARGVYYTPEPVVSYIVRSIDQILKFAFKLPKGLADSSKIKIPAPGTQKGPKGQIEVHKVQILDPATGTGTFLHGVVEHIHECFKNDKGMWSSYVSKHLLPRLYGFELLMAPYAVAHMKLGLQLKESGYDFQSSERIRVYLTNTLEEAHAMTGLPLFTQWIAEEANAASGIKKNAPVMVILGNPPYSNFGMMNKGAWILELLQDYKRGLNEKKTNLDEDSVKFIRFGQWRIEQTGYGVLAFVTSNTFIDGITHRKMRHSLMQTFDDIYILDLHGNSKKKEKSPDGSEDKNVFDIQQGVAITIFIKRSNSKSKKTSVSHADLWGTRDSKYAYLMKNDISSTKWKKVSPVSEHYFFTPKNFDVKDEYSDYQQLSDIFNITGSGVKTERDAISIHINQKDIESTVYDFRILDENTIRQKYNLNPDSRDWKIVNAKADVIANKTKSHYHRILYRPFDNRFTWYSGKTRGFIGTPGYPVMRHMLSGDNLGLLISRQVLSDFRHVFVTNGLANINAIDTAGKFGSGPFIPLYIFPTEGSSASLFDDGQSLGRKPNLTAGFIKTFQHNLKLSFVLEGKGDRKKSFGPEDVFSYMYAVFYSPSYRKRYAEFLKIDFPRLPLTSNKKLFLELCKLGDELIAVHLMKQFDLNCTSYPVAGANSVDKVRYQEPLGVAKGKVWINDAQYFKGITKELWEFQVGGYQVCDKWLKDRKGRQLSYDDLTHYQQIVSSLAKTMKLMKDVDTTIDKHGGWPIV